MMGLPNIYHRSTEGLENKRLINQAFRPKSDFCFASRGSSVRVRLPPPEKPFVYQYFTGFFGTIGWPDCSNLLIWGAPCSYRIDYSVLSSDPETRAGSGDWHSRPSALQAEGLPCIPNLESFFLLLGMPAKKSLDGLCKGLGLGTVTTEFSDRTRFSLTSFLYFLLFIAQCHDLGSYVEIMGR